jgi:LmbE family N-acetylglucosaminyl deacetylase
VTVLHVAPHPDDEALGAPATLLGLRDCGHRVVNLACGLGRAHADRERRRAEAEEACRRAGFELRVHDPPLELRDEDDERAVASAVARMVADDEVELVVAPSPTDAHPAHALVGRAVEATVAPVPLWQWSLWSDLPMPTLYAPFGTERLAEAQHVLAAHASQLERNDYAALLEARAVTGRVLGAERVFGFGAAPQSPEPYAEVLTELVGGVPTQARVLDASEVHPPPR